MILKDRLIVCEKVTRYIKKDIQRIKDLRFAENKIIAKKNCERLAENIHKNLAHLYTIEEIEYVQQLLGNHNWETVLYYINKYNQFYKQLEHTKEQ